MVALSPLSAKYDIRMRVLIHTVCLNVMDPESTRNGDILNYRWRQFFCFHRFRQESGKE